LNFIHDFSEKKQIVSHDGTVGFGQVVAGMKDGLDLVQSIPKSFGQSRNPTVFKKGEKNATVNEHK
jgi:hypothetical protein